MPKFYSPQMQTHKLVYTRLTGGNYRFYNFAVLRSSGLHFVLDMMRYDQAFFARESDVKHIVSILNQGMQFALQPFSLLLCKFDWQGKTKPNWTPARLTSDMEYEYIDSPMKLHDLGSEVESWHIKPPAKFKGIAEVTGTPSYILQAMHLNHAFPENESDANRIENGFYSVDKPLTIRLQTYTQSEQEWRFPTSP